MKINPNESATGFAGNVYNKGITIRTQIAAMCLQGLLANPSIIRLETNTAKIAVEEADYLIEELNKTT